MVGTVTAKSKTEAKKKFRDEIRCKKSRFSPGFYECSTEFMGKEMDLGLDLIKAKTIKEAKDKALRYRVRVYTGAGTRRVS